MIFFPCFINQSSITPHIHWLYLTGHNVCWISWCWSLFDDFERDESIINVYLVIELNHFCNILVVHIDAVFIPTKSMLLISGELELFTNLKLH